MTAGRQVRAAELARPFKIVAKRGAGKNKKALKGQKEADPDDMVCLLHFWIHI